MGPPATVGPAQALEPFFYGGQGRTAQAQRAHWLLKES